MSRGGGVGGGAGQPQCRSAAVPLVACRCSLQDTALEWWSLILACQTPPVQRWWVRIHSNVQLARRLFFVLLRTDYALRPSPSTLSLAQVKGRKGKERKGKERKRNSGNGGMEVSRSSPRGRFVTSREGARVDLSPLLRILVPPLTSTSISTPSPLHPYQT
jgi:hypothetical protein